MFIFLKKKLENFIILKKCGLVEEIVLEAEIGDKVNITDGPFMGQGLMAMVRRGFLTKVRQEREQIQIAEYSYKFKNLETGKTITEWYLNADSDYFNKEKFEDLTDYITVNSRFNVYKFNADQVVNYKTILVETVQAL